MILFSLSAASPVLAQESSAPIYAAAILSAIAIVVGIAILALLAKMRATSGSRENFESETKASLDKLAQDFAAGSGQSRAFHDAVQSALSQGRAEATKSSESLQKIIATTISAQFNNIGNTIEKMRGAMENSLAAQRNENAKKLDQMRDIVEEKLQKTLETRIGESFKQVSERLENVHKSLGEMQNLAASVGDLKNVLANVKTRGTWGEVRLKALLEDLLAPEQFECNVMPNPRSKAIVEFAIKLPGDDDKHPVYLPLDSKFPIEDYERLVKASEAADAAGVESASTQLCKNVEKFAREIRDKYIKPPYTTNFAILFLPTEGLYAEVLRNPGLVEKIQRDLRIVITGPTTLAALLNSLQMGFRTLAIKKNSAEIGKTLSIVKVEFEKFSENLEKISKKLDEAKTAVDATTKRHEAATKKLRKVETLDLGGDTATKQDATTNLLSDDSE